MNGCIFVGSFVDRDTTELPKGISLAGNYFQQKVRSILDFQNSISIFYDGGRSENKSNDKIEYVFLEQGRILHNVTHLASLLLRLGRRSDFRNALFYNISLYFLPLMVFFKFIKRMRIVIILADAGFLHRRSIHEWILSKALTYADGVLSLREMSEVRQLQAQIEIMPGIVLDNDLGPLSQKTPKTVFMSGSLGETTGFPLALQYFSSQAVYKLIITGTPYLLSSGQFAGLLEKHKSDNIEFLGVLDHADYIRVMSGCEYGLSLRNPADAEHQNNFPSKILEYMSYGLLVVSSMAYPELEKDTYYLADYSPVGLEQCFGRVLREGNSERSRVVEKARLQVEECFSEKVFRQKMQRLLGVVESGEEHSPSH